MSGEITIKSGAPQDGREGFVAIHIPGFGYDEGGALHHISPQQAERLAHALLHGAKVADGRAAREAAENKSWDDWRDSLVEGQRAAR